MQQRLSRSNWGQGPVLLTLRHDCGAKPVAEVFGEFAESRVAVNLDGLLGGIADDVAVAARGKMSF